MVLVYELTNRRGHPAGEVGAIMERIWSDHEAAAVRLMLQLILAQGAYVGRIIKKPSPGER